MRSAMSPIFIFLANTEAFNTNINKINSRTKEVWKPGLEDFEYISAVLCQKSCRNFVYDRDETSVIRNGNASRCRLLRNRLAEPMQDCIAP